MRFPNQTKLAARSWVSAISLGVLLLSIEVAYAGMTPEEVKMFRLSTLRAEKGYAQDQLLLAVCYHDGLGVQKDFERAVSWYRKAAEQGHPEAQDQLARCYYFGEGVAKDYAQATSFWRKAADNGLAEAQVNLARCYYSGEGVAKDYELAVFWYRKAAELGNAKGQLNLGIRYSKGEGVKKDDKLAVNWYLKAAEQGLTDAQFILSYNYYTGRGVAKDEVEAYAYLNLSGVTDEDARRSLAEIESKLSRDEISAGQKRTRDLRKEIEDKMAAKKSK